MLFIILLVWAGQSAGQPLKENSKPRLLFSINENPVYADEFIYLYKKNHVNPDDFTEKKINDYLDLLINFKLKVTEAKARGLDTTAVFHKEFKSYREELKKPYLIGKDELSRLTQEAYQRLTEEVKASHILVALQPNAQPADTLAAYQKAVVIRKGILVGEDFEKLARENSEDQTAKRNGGNLGYFTALQMVYPFEQAAYSLKVGEISMPVRTRFGYHVLKVTDRKPARGEVEVSHIILRTGSGDDTKVKNKIFEIYDQLQGGRSWDELCKEYSDDPATKDSGGKLRPFGVGALAGVPEFETVAFSLRKAGEISDPFQSTYGWHIVRLEKKIPVPPFAEVEAALKRRVGRDERLQIADHQIMEEKKRRYVFSEDLEMKKWFITLADSNLQKGKWKFKGDESLRIKTLFTLQNQNHKASEFISFIEKVQSPTNQTPEFCLTQLYDRLVKEKVDELEEKKLEAENPSYRNLLVEYREGILLFTIMEKEVWNKASDDTLGLRKFYEENKERKYRAGDRVRAKIFSAPDKGFRDEVRRKVEAGDSLKPEDVKKFKSIQPFRNYGRGESKAVDKVPWAIGLHDAEVDGTHYLVEIDNLVPPGVKSLQETRAQVVSDYQDSLEKKWISDLKMKYLPKVNNKGKKFVVSELMKK